MKVQPQSQRCLPGVPAALTRHLGSALLVVVLLLPGCAGFNHASTLANFQGYVVPTASKPGTCRLETEMAYDRTLKTYVEVYGRPEFIYVIDRHTVLLLYRKADKTVTFARSWSPESRVTEKKGLPADLLMPPES